MHRFPKTQAEHKAALERQLIRDKGNIPPMPDGPRLDHFSANELAAAIEWEVSRTGSLGGTRIRLDMDLNDAQQLASYLRRAVLSGV